MSVNGASVIASIVGFLLFTSGASVPAAQTPDAAAAAVLKRARQWAGEAALSRVQSISIAWQRRAVKVRQQARLRWPSQFQIRYSSSGEPFATATDISANTLDGNNFWQKFRIPVPPESAARANRGMLTDFTKASITYLLRLPGRPDVAIKGLGRRAILGMDGEALLVTDPNRLFHVFLIDASTGAPLGYVQNTKADGGINGPTDHRVERFSDFRDVGGIRFPFRVDEIWDAPPSVKPDVTIRDIELIELNTLTPADFKQAK